jgi:hypothetical protein
MDNATGASITFATGFFAEILDFNGPGMTRESLRTSHLGSTTWHSFIPGDLTDPGELSLTLGFDPSTDPPINDAAETCTITFPDGSTWSGTAFMISFTPRGALEEIMTADATVKFTGTITVSGGGS